jgi:transcriptional regulator with XRE-family HTH domain
VTKNFTMSKLLYLKEILAEKGIKQTFVANKLGVSNTTVSLWVQGKTEPTLANLKKLSEVLFVDANTLINGKKEWR